MRRVITTIWTSTKNLLTGNRRRRIGAMEGDKEKKSSGGGTIAPPHIIAIPFLGHGHLTPLAHLCATLAANHGFLVTLVSIGSGPHASPPSPPPPPSKLGAHLRFRHASLPFPGPEPDTLDFRSHFAATERLGNALRGLMRSMIEEEDCPRISGIVSDVLCSSWTQEVADEFSIPRIAFFAFSLSMGLYSTYLPSLLANSDSGNVCESGNDLVLPGLPRLHPRDIPTFVHMQDVTEISNQFTARQFIHLGKAKRVLVNTFEELEGEAMEEMMSKKIPICVVGPLNLIKTETSVSYKRLCCSEEQEECISWLNEKTSSSVLYISFGSMTILSIEQLHEIIYGLEATQIPFLFVLRPGMVDTTTSNDSSFLDGLRERCTKNHGFVTSWAPQLSVLSHPSIGAFFTHCGWNSVMESISYGVPMMCWPYFADQMLNCKFVVEEWVIGMECCPDEDGLVKRVEIENISKKIMQGEEGKELKKRALKLKEAAAMAGVAETGSSFKNILDLVEVLRSSEECKMDTLQNCAYKVVV